ncbi:C40 family peptidase [Mycobacteroides abscessus]|uniref:C40 family peptidase n=1 Tax=Mycobacteroides abscessus TaxID=36809 RepID=UPI0021043C55|nr:NlpC/P60 family protein [Mycobacteroides abscessus]
MAIDALLEGMDRLFGPARAQGASAADAVRAMAPPTIPASWSSPAAQSLADRHQTLSRAGDVFAASDDDVKAKVDAAGAAVADGKTQMGAIKDDYKLNRDRLAPAASNPEVAHRMSELDRQRSSDGANTVRSTLGRLPQFGSGGAMPAMSQLGSMMPAAMAPMSMLAPALGAPLQALQSLQGLAAPATSMLSGLSIPQTVTHQGTPSAMSGHGAIPKVGGHGSEAGKRIAENALKYLGLPYVWGGGDKNGPTCGIEGGTVPGLDCSGLVIASVYEATDIVMPRKSQDQVNVGMAVDAGSVQAGDLVFFKDKSGDYGHVAVAISENQIVEAPNRGSTVSTRTFDPSAANVTIKRVA